MVGEEDQRPGAETAGSGTKSGTTEQGRAASRPVRYWLRRPRWSAQPVSHRSAGGPALLGGAGLRPTAGSLRARPLIFFADHASARIVERRVSSAAMPSMPMSHPDVRVRAAGPPPDRG